MRTIIAGSRDITDYAIVEAAIAASNFRISQVISGGARGVDSLAEWHATKYDLPLTVVPARWKEDGRGAGYKRNLGMARVSDALIAVWDGKSPGTAHMIETAKKLGLQVFVWYVNEDTV